jgi:hypothetical protein
MKSILGKYYSRIRGSQEDIVSEGLVELLDESNNARKVFSSMLRGTGLKGEAEIFTSQSSGENNERPDISIKDKDRKEIGLIEAKFWAGLTPNQPVTYLDRIEDGGLLLFVCPELRTLGLMNSLKRKLEVSDYEITSTENTSVVKVTSNGKQKTLAVLSWNDVFNQLDRVFIRTLESEVLVSNYIQIKGLCHEVDSKSFKPIQEEELSPMIPSRIISYLDLIDKTVDRLKSEIAASTKGLNATGQREGYVRYMRLENLGLGLMVDLNLWKDYEDTPIWFSVTEWEGEEKWEKYSHKVQLVANQFSSKVIKGKQRVVFPLFLNSGVTEEEILDKMVKDIKEIIAGVKIALNY